MKPVSALLHRRPDEAGRKAQGCRQRRRTGEGPARAGKDAGQDAFVGDIAGAVEDAAHRKAQQNAAEHTGVHGLDAQHGGLARTVQSGEGVRLGQLPQRGQGDVARREVDQIAHQGDEPGLVLFLLSQRRRNADAEQHAEVRDDRRQAFVDELAQQLHQRPAEKRQHSGQRRTGEQGTRHQQQPRRRKIGKRGQHRLGKALQRLGEPVFHTLRLSFPVSPAFPARAADGGPICSQPPTAKNVKAANCTKSAFFFRQSRCGGLKFVPPALIDNRRCRTYT